MDQIFSVGDPSGGGAISAHAAQKLFTGSHLRPEVLKSIWDIANVEDHHTFNKHTVGSALRLVGHAQQGKAVTEELVNEGACGCRAAVRDGDCVEYLRLIQRALWPLSTALTRAATSRPMMLGPPAHGVPIAAPGRPHQATVRRAPSSWRAPQQGESFRYSPLKTARSS